MKTVILDNGHGKNTKGKRSPVGMLSKGTALFEFEFNRDIVSRVMNVLDAEEIDYVELVPEVEDISLVERVNRVNKLGKNHFLVSVHANAGRGTGWEIFTSVGQTESDNIAQIFYEEAKEKWPNFRMRTDNSDGDADKEAHFYILRKTNCPAVLTENFFMDNEEDLAYLITDEGRQEIAEVHAESIIKYING